MFQLKFSLKIWNNFSIGSWGPPCTNFPKSKCCH